MGVFKYWSQDNCNRHLGMKSLWNHDGTEFQINFCNFYFWFHYFHAIFFSSFAEIPGVRCHGNRCLGLNAKLNLKLATDRVLIPLMNNPPSSAKKVIGQIQAQLQSLEMTSDQLADMFNGLLAKAGQ